MVRLEMVGLVLASPSHMLFKSSYCVVLIVVMKYLKQINENIISFVQALEMQLFIVFNYIHLFYSSEMLGF